MVFTASGILGQFKKLTARNSKPVSVQQSDLPNETLLKISQKLTDHDDIIHSEETRRWFSTASFDWLLTVSFNKPNEIFLLNPSTQEQIKLPAAADFDKPENLRVITSTNPLDTNCVVLAIQNLSLALCKPGDEKWTIVTGFHIPNYHKSIKEASVIFYKDDFYVVDYHGKIFRLCVNVCGINKVVELPVLPVTLRFDERYCFWNIGYYLIEYYLVELKEDLLLVLGFTTEKPASTFSRFRSYTTEMFELYKLDWIKNQWIEVKNIGNENAVILAKHNSRSVDDVVGIDGDAKWKGNCIYFLNDWGCSPKTGVYNMETKDIEWIVSSYTDLSDLGK